MLPSIYDIWYLMPPENWNYILIGVVLYAMMSFKDGFCDTWADEFKAVGLWFFLWPLMVLILVVNLLRRIFR